jgi:putative pyruvate formate lyase activating enzyme
MKSPSSLPPPADDYQRAAEALEPWLKACALCPRRCRVNRLAGELGFCTSPGHGARAGSAALHFGEEPPISGQSGSGTVFFCGCTLSCRFCQNHDISQGGQGRIVDPEGLAAIFMQLQLAGAHNLNLVTPTPHVVVILKALARSGIKHGYVQDFHPAEGGYLPGFEF